jgi:hypothetical protein
MVADGEGRNRNYSVMSIAINAGMISHKSPFTTKEY